VRSVLKPIALRVSARVSAKPLWLTRISHGAVLPRLATAVCEGIVSLISTAAGWFFALAIAASPPAETKTCQKLDTAYREHLDVTADALRHYQQCLSVKAAPGACGVELSDFQTAQESLQASFSSYAKTCGSTFVRSGKGDPRTLAFSAQAPESD